MRFFQKIFWRRWQSLLTPSLAKLRSGIIFSRLQTPPQQPVIKPLRVCEYAGFAVRDGVNSGFDFNAGSVGCADNIHVVSSFHIYTNKQNKRRNRMRLLSCLLSLFCRIAISQFKKVAKSILFGADRGIWTPTDVEYHWNLNPVGFQHLHKINRIF